MEPTNEKNTETVDEVKNTEEAGAGAEETAAVVEGTSAVVEGTSADTDKKSETEEKSAEEASEVGVDTEKIAETEEKSAEEASEAGVDTEKIAETDEKSVEEASEVGVDTEKIAETEEKSAEEASTVEKTPEEIKAERVKKIKLGIVAAGGVFILLAVVYIAAMLGGRNTAIEEEKETVVVAIPTEAPEAEPTAEPTVEPEQAVVVEEETPEESIIGVVQGSARYDECIYADGGSIVVRKADKYGAIDYEGKEIVPVKYTDVCEIPTKEGMFVLSTSKRENVTEEKDGTTYSYEEVTTTYTLFDSTGKELYKGNDRIVVSGDTYILGIEDKEDYRKTRVEYHKLGTKGKPFLTLYVNDQFSLNGFMDGMTTVMGFTAVPTDDQDSNPTNLYAGTMNTSGKVTWFAKAPGIDKFEAEVKQWKEDNKLLQQNIKKSAKKNKAEKAKEKEEEEILYDEDGNPIESSEIDENTDEEIEDIDEESEDGDIEDEDSDDEESEDGDIEDEYADDEEVTDELAGGPVFHMDEILNAPVGGFFVYKDLYDVEDPYHWYTDKGVWYADLDTAYLTPDAKKGFKIGNFNNGDIEVKGYVVDGETYYNFGAYMVLTIGDKDVLIDMSKAKGMTTDSITDKIVVAIYDEINISANDCWMYKDGDKAGYLDLKGQPIKVVYEDATSFVNGYALAVKDGKAIIINEKFDTLEEIGEAKTVDIVGDVMIVSNGSDIRRYMLKETRNAPMGDCILNATAEGAEDAKVTPEASSTAKKKKKK